MFDSNISIFYVFKSSKNKQGPKYKNKKKLFRTGAETFLGREAKTKR